MANNFYRYLVETGSFTDLKAMCRFSQEAITTLSPTERSIHLTATVSYHLAIRPESLGSNSDANVTATKCYEHRLAEEPLNLTILVWTRSNLGYMNNTANNNTANQHQVAMQFLESVRVRWQSIASVNRVPVPWPTVQKSCLGRCLMYLGELDEAQRLLQESVEGFRLATPVIWGGLAVLVDMVVSFLCS